MVLDVKEGSEPALYPKMGGRRGSEEHGEKAQRREGVKGGNSAGSQAAGGAEWRFELSWTKGALCG